MSNVIMHVFSAKDGIPVLNPNGSGDILGLLRKGEWMGVLQEFEDYFHVISSEHIGKVLKTNCVLTTDYSQISISIPASTPVYRI